MFGRRDFEEDSSSSFEAEEPGTPPGGAVQLGSGIDRDFDFYEKPTPSHNKGMPLHQSEAPGFQPMKKNNNDKVGFVPLVDEPAVETNEVYERPVSSNNRPGSSSAQMRQKMMEAKKKQLMDRPGATVTVSSGGLLGNMKMESAPLSNALNSGPIMNEKDLTGNKSFKPFTTSGSTFEPSKKNQFESLPGPIKAEVAIIGREEIEEVKLDETTATKNEPSQILKDMQRKTTEVKVEQPKPRLEIQAPVHIEAKVVEPKSKIEETKYEEIKLSKEEETKKPVEVNRNSADVKKPEQREEAKLSMNQRLPPANIKEILANEMRDIKKFLTSPVKKGINLQCSIRREKSGFNRFFPKYFLQTSEGLNFLLAGKKRAGNKTSNYMITSDQKDFNTKSASFLGKVRSNFLGTEFIVYDSGLNPKRKGANPSNIRAELGVVMYESNIMGSKGPRKMHVLAPSAQESGELAVWKPMNKNESMIAAYKDQRGIFNNMCVYFNKPPKWNEHVQAFVLNFNGRVDKASVKNFQLIDDKDENRIYLQFGRVGDQVFNLDFQWPFSPLLAFGIALTSFDNKFACE